MSHQLRFHVLLLPNVDWREFRARAVHLEAVGIDTIAVADHFTDWTNPSAYWFECWTAMTAIAEATSTIRLASGVAQIPLRNPAMLARQVLTLDHVSNGRVELGLGTGLTIDPSYAMTGIPNWETGERVSRFAEYVELVSLLLGQEETTYAGTWYQAAGAFMNPRPVQSPRPPITVAALGPRMMRIAARFADTWSSLSFLPKFTEQIDETRERCRMMDDICAQSGRQPASLARSYLMFDSQARHNGGAIDYYTSVDRFTHFAEQLIELGISDLGLYYPADPAQLPTFEHISATVLPALRSKYPSI